MNMLQNSSILAVILYLGDFAGYSPIRAKEHCYNRLKIYRYGNLHPSLWTTLWSLCGNTLWTSCPVISIFSYTSRNSCPVIVSIFRMIERRRWVSHSGSNPRQQTYTTQGHKRWSHGMTNISIPDMNMLQNSSILTVILYLGDSAGYSPIRAEERCYNRLTIYGNIHLCPFIVIVIYCHNNYYYYHYGHYCN